MRDTPSSQGIASFAWRGWVLPLALLGLWWLAFAQAWVRSPLLVSPQTVWAYGIDQLLAREVYASLWASLRRDLLGLLAGAAVGLLLGALMGGSTLAAKLLNPSFNTLKQISLFAWIPMLSVWFGLGDAAKIAFIALAAFFPMVLNTYEGVRSVPASLREVARLYGLTQVQRQWQLVLPWALPSILTGLHLSLIYAWLASIGAEYLLVSGVGIGNLIIDGRDNFRMDQVLFGVLVIGAVGALLNVLASALEQRALRWRSQTVARYGSR